MNRIKKKGRPKNWKRLQFCMRNPYKKNSPSIIDEKSKNLSRLQFYKRNPFKIYCLQFYEKNPFKIDSTRLRFYKKNPFNITQTLVLSLY